MWLWHCGENRITDSITGQLVALYTVALYTMACVSQGLGSDCQSQTLDSGTQKLSGQGCTTNSLQLLGKGAFGGQPDGKACGFSQH